MELVSWVAVVCAAVGPALLVVRGFQESRRRLREYIERDDGGAGAPVPPASTDFEALVLRALEELPAEHRDRMSNVEIVVEDEPPAGAPWLGLYSGVPLTRRTQGYAWIPPDKITIYRGPLERLYGRDPELLAAEVRHTVLHEIAHHFGISDQRLVEIDRY